MLPVGRIKGAVRKWEVTGANSYISDVVPNGYKSEKSPFIDLTQSARLANNKSTRENKKCCHKLH